MKDGLLMGATQPKTCCCPPSALLQKGSDCISYHWHVTLSVSVSATTSEWANEGSSVISTFLANCCKLYICLKLLLNSGSWDVSSSILCCLETVFTSIPQKEKNLEVCLQSKDFQLLPDCTWKTNFFGWRFRLDYSFTLKGSHIVTSFPFLNKLTALQNK